MSTSHANLMTALRRAVPIHPPCSSQTTECEASRPNIVAFLEMQIFCIHRDHARDIECLSGCEWMLASHCCQQATTCVHHGALRFTMLNQCQTVQYPDCKQHPLTAAMVQSLAMKSARSVQILPQLVPSKLERSSHEHAVDPDQSWQLQLHVAIAHILCG